MIFRVTHRLIFTIKLQYLNCTIGHVLFSRLTVGRGVIKEQIPILCWNVKTIFYEDFDRCDKLTYFSRSFEVKVRIIIKRDHLVSCLEQNSVFNIRKIVPLYRSHSKKKKGKEILYYFHREITKWNWSFVTWPWTKFLDAIQLTYSYLERDNVLDSLTVFDFFFVKMC